MHIYEVRPTQRSSRRCAELRSFAAKFQLTVEETMKSEPLAHARGIVFCLAAGNGKIGREMAAGKTTSDGSGISGSVKVCDLRVGSQSSSKAHDYLKLVRGSPRH